MTLDTTRVSARRSAGTFEIGLGFAAFAALGVMVPALILIAPDSGRSAGWVLTFVILLASAFRISVLVASGERRIFEFIFWLFCYVFFGLAPTVQLRADNMPTTTLGLDPALDLPTAATAVLGVASFAIGFAVAHRMRDGVRATRIRRVNQNRLIVLSLVSVASAAFYISRVGIANLLSSRAELGAVENLIWADPTTNALIGAIAGFPAVIAAHGWWSLVRERPTGGRRIVAWVFTLLSMFIVNPVSSARYHFGVVWGSYLGPLGAYRSRRRTSITMVLIVFGLLFLFPIADLFRRVGVVNSTRTGFLDEYAGNGDYDAFGQLSNAILYNATMPFDFARQFLGVLFFWLPRSIWSDKPEGTGVLLANFRGYSFTNLSAPIWAEMLLSFGFVGIVVCSILLGILLGRLDRRFVLSEASPILAIAGSVFPFYLLILMRGSLLQATGILVVLVGSLLFISTRRDASDAASPP